MHEVGLMQEVLMTAEREMRRHGAIRILRIVLRVGGLSGAVPEALESAFAVLSPATAAVGATLICEPVEARAFCENCRREFAVTAHFFECPECKTLSAELRQGRELQLSSLELA